MVHRKENRHMDQAMIQRNLTTTRPCMCRELPSVMSAPIHDSQLELCLIPKKVKENKKGTLSLFL